MRCKTNISLELLRHGPAHNQLLSPLTRYHALCGNHDSVMVSVPFEQRRLEARLKELRPQGRRESEERPLWARTLEELAQTMAEVLEIPSLVSELPKSQEDPESLVHLEMVLSASELALLPFELAHAPTGFPGAGQPLTLQNQAPICLTRRARRVGQRNFEWPEKPKILLAAAQPYGVAHVPLRAHVRALRDAIDPWIFYYKNAERESFGQGKEKEAERDEFHRRIEDHLVVLPAASTESIGALCREHAFTHVHLLAHGLPIRQDPENRFGLALHKGGGSSELDLVDGERLASALQGSGCKQGGGGSLPTVLSIASCDSGNQGSVVGLGASLAHTLHEQGIPLVVASQFPLSFRGSVLLAQELYGCLLWGEDPRVALHQLRHRLRSEVSDFHDWAGLVTYASLPKGLSHQVRTSKGKRARRSIEAALSHADGVLSGQSEGPAKDEDLGPWKKDLSRKIDGIRERIREGKKRLQDSADGESGKVDSLLASAEKREGQVLIRGADLLEEEAAKRQGEAEAQECEGIAAGYQEDALRHLRIAHAYYRKAFRAKKPERWALVQYLVLGELLGKREDDHRDQWELSRLQSVSDWRNASSTKAKAWALCNLVELHLIHCLIQGNLLEEPRPSKADLDLASSYAEDLVKLEIAKARSFEIYSTRRQLQRYVDWLGEIPLPKAAIEALKDKGTLAGLKKESAKVKGRSKESPKTATVQICRASGLKEAAKALVAILDSHGGGYKDAVWDSTPAV